MDQPSRYLYELHFRGRICHQNHWTRHNELFSGYLEQVRFLPTGGFFWHRLITRGDAQKYQGRKNRQNHQGR